MTEEELSELIWQAADAADKVYRTIAQDVFKKGGGADNKTAKLLIRYCEVIGHLVDAHAALVLGPQND